MTTIDSNREISACSASIIPDEWYSKCDTSYFFRFILSPFDTISNISNCHLRFISDKGSLSESLKAANIDIFDCVPKPENVLLKTIRNVARFSLLFFKMPAYFVGGLLIQSAWCIKHTFLSIQKNQDHSYHLTKIDKLMKNIAIDLTVMTIFPVASMILVFPYTSSIMTAVIVSYILCNAIRSFKGAFEIEGQSGAPKSALLWQKYGIVSAETGKLLSWDIKKDQDIQWGWKDFKLKGYFGELYQKYNQDYSNLIDNLKKNLEKKGIHTFPVLHNRHNILSFLNQPQISEEFTLKELAQWKEAIERIHQRKNDLKDFLFFDIPRNDFSAYEQLKILLE
jgi:hypothetical protein